MSDVPTLTADDLADLRAKVDAGEIQLTAGHHDVAESGEACAMDLIVWRATGAIGDTHECVHPMISSLIHALNDRPEATPESRWELVENAGPTILGTSQLPNVGVAFALLGAEDGATLARNLDVLREHGQAEVYRRWMELSLTAPASSSGDWAPASSSGDGAPASSSGDWAPASSSGYWAPASSSGVRAPASSSGVRAPASSSGDWAPASSSGDGAPASSSGDGAPASSSGYWAPAVAFAGAPVRCGPEGYVIAVWFDPELGNRPRPVIGEAGIDGIEPHVWYRAVTPGVLERVPDDECPTEGFMRSGIR